MIEIVVNTQTYSPQNLGTWKPLESRGECGTRATNENIVGGTIAQVSMSILMARVVKKLERFANELFLYLLNGLDFFNNLLQLVKYTIDWGISVHGSVGLHKGRRG